MHSAGRAYLLTCSIRLASLYLLTKDAFLFVYGNEGTLIMSLLDIALFYYIKLIKYTESGVCELTAGRRGPREWVLLTELEQGLMCSCFLGQCSAEKHHD